MTQCPNCGRVVKATSEGFCQQCIREIDPEARMLVLAMNKLPGIQTFESCWGHGRDQFRVWFAAETPDDVAVLIDLIETCEWPQGERWIIEPWMDLPDQYILRSRDRTSATYGQSRMIAVAIRGVASPSSATPLTNPD